ncbi:MAG: 50S ribosomal protein L24 [Puniceicoccales bacterium]|jgi:large subunit ribosomal protein L24|nr:50S ribosomal protein L24 [Puniceicoccales bacterium]
MKSTLKRNDEVVVICGDDKGKFGKVLQVLREKSRVVVEGVALMAKHVKKSQQYPEGAIIKVERSIHVSNVALKAKYDDKRRSKISQ